MLWIDLTSVYIRRAMGRLPKQGAHAPGKLSQSYLRDIGALRFGRTEDDVLRFETAGPGGGGRGLTVNSGQRA